MARKNKSLSKSGQGHHPPWDAASEIFNFDVSAATSNDCDDDDGKEEPIAKEWAEHLFYRNRTTNSLWLSVLQFRKSHAQNMSRLAVSQFGRCGERRVVKISGIQFLSRQGCPLKCCGKTSTNEVRCEWPATRWRIWGTRGKSAAKKVHKSEE